MNLRFQSCLKLALTGVFSLVVGLLMPGCFGEKREVLRVGISLDPENELLYLAAKKGFFHKSGVDVRIVEFLSASDCQRAYARGQINAMAASVLDFLYLRDRSNCAPQIVRVLDVAKESDVVLVKPGYVGQSLRNQRIGVEMGSLGAYLLIRALEKDALTLSEVKAVSMSPNAMEDAFRNGLLDAVVTYPPFSTRLLQDNLGRCVFSANDIHGEILGVLGVDERLIRRQKGDVIKLLQGYEMAVDFWKEHPDEAYSIMADREGLSVAAFEEVFKRGGDILSEADQKGYFGPSGKLRGLIQDRDRVLRQVGQLVGPSRSEDLVGDLFMEPQKGGAK